MCTQDNDEPKAADSRPEYARDTSPVSIPIAMKVSTCELINLHSCMRTWDIRHLLIFILKCMAVKQISSKYSMYGIMYLLVHYTLLKYIFRKKQQQMINSQKCSLKYIIAADTNLYFHTYIYRRELCPKQLIWSQTIQRTHLE